MGTNIGEILAERGSRYGDFKGHASITMALKTVIREYDGLLNDSQREALDMIVHKIGRILNGNPNYADSWVDIAGYAKLVADQLSTDSTPTDTDPKPDLSVCTTSYTPPLHHANSIYATAPIVDEPNGKPTTAHYSGSLKYPYST